MKIAIPLAIVIVGRWNPWRLALVSLLFGFLDALALRAQALGVGLPYQLLLALPYLVTLLVYAGLVGRAPAPEARIEKASIAARVVARIRPQRRSGPAR